MLYFDDVFNSAAHTEGFIYCISHPQLQPQGPRATLTLVAASELSFEQREAAAHVRQEDLVPAPQRAVQAVRDARGAAASAAAIHELTVLITMGAAELGGASRTQVVIDDRAGAAVRLGL